MTNKQKEYRKAINILEGILRKNESLAPKKSEKKKENNDFSFADFVIENHKKRSRK
ncbi:MAG: hypothetical protein ACRCUS_03350 [Anaerovoracaceae bacterium]